MKRWFSRDLPYMSKPHALVEFRAWSLFAVATGALAGGLSGVLVTNAFAATVNGLWLGVAVALVTGAAAFANILSLFWAQLAAGRSKTRMLARLQLGFAISLSAAALVPVSATGLLLFVLAVLLAQAFWAGNVTVRAIIWRLNYGRDVRTRFTARMLMSVSWIMAATALGAGALIEQNPLSFRWIIAIAALFSFAGLAAFGPMRVRGHRRLLRAERSRLGDRRFSLERALSILRTDRDYRNYMLAMFVFGGGNLMFTAPLILSMVGYLDVPRFSQVALLAAIPAFLIPLALPFWARLLSAQHITAYRARHGWTFVAAIGLMTAACLLRVPELLWLGSCALGIAYAGGRLGWNLGHNDFAPEALATDYMGLHVTLTGIRGLVMPVLGVLLYHFLEARSPGLGPNAMLLPLALTTTGAVAFVYQASRLKKSEEAPTR